MRRTKWIGCSTAEDDDDCPDAQPLQPLPHALPDSGSEWHEGDAPGASKRCPKARIQPGRDGRSHQPATRAIVRARVAGA
ncbi:hypothetical protein BEK67_17225 [Ralstonia pickettii]|nr:hypothetical protein BEK67_17225 [Ralstonia pickettii]